MVDQKRFAHYRDWLLANADKKGTPDFDTVAAEYRSMYEQLNPQPQNTESGLLAALAQGGDSALSTIGMGIQGLADIDILPGNNAMREAGQDMVEAAQNRIAARDYVRPDSAQGNAFTKLRQGDIMGAVPTLAYSVAEGAPSVVPGAAMSVGGALLSGTGAGAVAGVPMMALGGSLVGTQTLGAQRQEKIEQGLDPSTTGTDIATAAGSAALEVLPIGKLRNVARLGVVREGAQEALQEGMVIGSVASQGGQYEGMDVVDRMGESALVGGIVSKGADIAISTVDGRGLPVFKTRQELSPVEQQSNAGYAHLIEEGVRLNGYNLRDTNPRSQSGARTALDYARSRTQVQAKAAMDEIKNQVGDDLTQLDIRRLEAMMTALNNKVSTTVPPSEIEWMLERLGNVKGVRELADAALLNNVGTQLYSDGLIGGVSQFTEMFHVPMGMRRAGAFVVNATTFGAANLAAKGIDKVTGRRSRVARFVRNNAGKQGLPKAERVIDLAASRAMAMDATEGELSALDTAKLTGQELSNEIARARLRQIQQTIANNQNQEQRRQEGHQTQQAARSQSIEFGQNQEQRRQESHSTIETSRQQTIDLRGKREDRSVESHNARMLANKIAQKRAEARDQLQTARTQQQMEQTDLNMDLARDRNERATVSAQLQNKAREQAINIAATNEARKADAAVQATRAADQRFEQSEQDFQNRQENHNAKVAQREATKQQVAENEQKTQQSQKRLMQSNAASYNAKTVPDGGTRFYMLMRMASKQGIKFSESLDPETVNFLDQQIEQHLVDQISKQDADFAETVELYYLEQAGEVLMDEGAGRVLYSTLPKGKSQKLSPKEEGRAKNERRILALRGAVEADPDISDNDKMVLDMTLQEFDDSLSSDPEARIAQINKIVEAAEAQLDEPVNIDFVTEHTDKLIDQALASIKREGPTVTPT